MSSNTRQININRSINELISDIKRTDEPIKKTILQRFLDIKIKQAKEHENNNKILVMNKRHTDNKINKILATQQSSLNMLERINNIKSKENNIMDTKKQTDTAILNKARGDNESKWKTSYDPKYAKYMKEDTMNNRMMERLNSEIDFRQSECDKSEIEKPFDVNTDTENTTESY